MEKYLKFVKNIDSKIICVLAHNSDFNFTSGEKSIYLKTLTFDLCDFSRHQEIYWTKM